MKIKIIVKNILEIIYTITYATFYRSDVKMLIRVKRGHPIFKSTITREIYSLESTKKYLKF